MRSRRGAACAALLVLSGCGDGQNGVGASVRDSAGVALVEHAPGAAAHAARWTLPERPRLVIGAADGDPALQFFRVAGGAVLSDGTIAVLNAGTMQVRLFDAGGTPMATAGGRGEGPGEFVRPGRMVRTRGDSLLVLDEPLQRITVLSAAGSFARAARLTPPVLNPFLVGAFEDGSVLLADFRLEVPERDFAVSNALLLRYSAEGVLLDSLGAFPWMEIGILGEPGAGRVGRRTFAPLAYTASRGSRFWFGSGEPAIAVHGDDGRLQRSIRWVEPDRAVQPRDVEAYLDARCATVSNERCRLYRETPAMDRFPAHEDVVADASGNLWVKAYRRPTAAGADTWLIFDESGALIARSETPARLRVLDIGDTWLLGLLTDELDVERVALYDLRRTGGD